MKVLAAPETEAFVRAHGGRLFVWTDRTLCCGGAMTFLKSSVDPPEGEHHFQEFARPALTVYLDSGRFEPPYELHVAVRGWRRKRIDAFWNGCAYLAEAIVAPSPRLQQA